MDKAKYQHILTTKVKQYRVQKYLITKPAKLKGWSTKTYLSWMTDPIKLEGWVEALEANMSIPATAREKVVVADRVAKLKEAWTVALTGVSK